MNVFYSRIEALKFFSIRSLNLDLDLDDPPPPKKKKKNSATSSPSRARRARPPSSSSWEARRRSGSAWGCFSSSFGPGSTFEEGEREKCKKYKKNEKN